VRDRHPGIVFNAHYVVDGGIVFKNACALEGARLLSDERAEEDWGNKRRGRWR
jgi:hypothetical protein